MAIWAVDLDVSNALISVLNMVVGLADVVAYISGGGATGLICHLYFGIDGVRRRFLGSITEIYCTGENEEKVQKRRRRRGKVLLQPFG
jgi:hypothetical protein